MELSLPSYSLLDILNENLKKAGRKSYLHRVVYVFDYNKLNIDGAEVNMEQLIRNLVVGLNEADGEPITGMLLLYDKYGVNMIEGSEESIFRHFQELTDSHVIGQCVPRIKILLFVTHIAQRILSHWSIFGAQPQTLLERLDVSNVEETSRRIKMIVAKLYNIWSHLRYHGISTMRQISLEHLSDRMTTNLPEAARLEFVLSTPALKDMRTFVNHHRTVQQPRLYQESVWPPAKEFIPFTIFKVENYQTRAANGSKLTSDSRTATREVTREVTREPTREVTREPTREVTREPTREVTREPTREVIREPTREVTREPTREVTREPTREATREPTREVTREPTRDV